MRRRFVFALLFLAACGDDISTLPEVTDSTEYVDPRIGTGGLGFGHGSCFVGALVPHGLAKPGPDTNGPFGVVSFQHYSGYFAEDNRIRGFSQLHLHGTGATDYGVLSLMPTLAFDASKQKVTDYETVFAKEDERAEAGYYGVKLANGIDVELTATTRVAVHRYTLPSAGAVVVDLTKVLDSGTVDASEIHVAGEEVYGSLHHLGGMSDGFGGYTVYFSMMSDRPFASAAEWTGGAALTLPAGKTTIAIGLSFVSLDGARANLRAEVAALDFDALRGTAREAWRTKLDVIKLTGGTAEQRRTFYTSFYHAFMMPTVIDDADHSYVLAPSRTVKQHDASWDMVSDMSLWDTYRTTGSLYSWLAPKSARDQVFSLGAFSEELGYFPKWPVAIGESGTMLGSSAEIVIADAIVRGGLAGLTLDHTMLFTSTGGGRSQVNDYIQYGYVPRTSGGRTASLTVEYAHDDFALAQISGDAALLERSHGWRKLYDPAVGFIRARNADGSFPTGSFDPNIWLDDYAEADAWQSLFEAGIHDPEGVAEILGGNEAAIAKLTEFFEKAKTERDNGGDAAGSTPPRYYWGGNETDLNAAFLFAQLGRPDLTQKWLRWATDTYFSDQPDGVPGNDDGGTMGAWYVFATLGLYPVAGSDRYVVGAPRFKQARVSWGGHELTIAADGISDSAMFVKSVDLDGVPMQMPYLTQAQLNSASTLHFVMTSKAP
ncbi:MAG TPA: GH92 family glycosyl hydrolase [Kofleriaceae bacterium]|nr:GH92 family glycosyl hydrolase [Kofleriaceae bacterium]